MGEKKEERKEKRSRKSEVMKATTSEEILFIYENMIH